MRRMRLNPKYSLRSFARKLELEPSELSKMIRGKRSVTDRVIEKVIRNLNLPQGFESVLRQEARDSTSDFFAQLSLDTFEVVSSWEAFAILELIPTKGFRADPKWIAQRIGVSTSEVRSLCELLIDRKIIKVDSKGRWSDNSGNVTTLALGYQVASLGRLQSALLHKAIEAVEFTDPADRDQTALTFAFDKNRLLELKEKIKKFRREIAEWAGSEGIHDEVYQLTISLFPLTKKVREPQS